jgi:glycosyltransferase involved in cell wall biosynthesis
MTIHYLVAGLGHEPNGGLRIIYEQARRLAERGHPVEIHHFERFATDRWRRIPRHLWNFFVKRKAADPAWIALPPAVKKTYSFFARHPAVMPGDKVVATYWKTHTIIEDRIAPGFDYFYLIQGFENWIVDEKRLFAQWRSPSANLVVSKFLKAKVESIGAEATLIPNAIDFDFFTNINPDRAASRTVVFCSMASFNKGSRDIVKAIGQLQSAGHDIKAISFGDTDPSTFGPIACEHFQLPDQAKIRELYNAATVFISASYSEGWGLTLAEATLCGCALLVSDAEGHFEFARPGKSALFFRRGDADSIARKLAFLLGRPALRGALNRNAARDLAPFSWDRSIDRLEEALGVAQPAA